MKKIIVIIALALFCNLGGTFVYAQTSTQATLGKLEDSLFGFQYDEESDLARLDRIETSVYGAPSKASQSQRLAKLRKDLSADLIGQEIEPVEDTFADASDSWVDEPPKAASNVSYPAVDELEKVVFNKTFPKDDISVRLSNLEKKAFNKTFADDLNTRTERLKAELKPQSFMDNQIAQSSNAFYDQDDVVPLGGDFHMNKYMQHDPYDYSEFNARQNAMFNDDYGNSSSLFDREPKKASLSTVEKKLMKQNFNNDSMENRLARVEQYMFGTVFESDDQQTRLNRISSAYNAQKSSGKYDSNGFARNMTTGVQIGMLILMVLACIL